MKAHLTSFGLPQADGCESHDAFAVKAWDETVIAVLADSAGPSSGGPRSGPTRGSFVGEQL